jgi:hypothetical protein
MLLGPENPDCGNIVVRVRQVCYTALARMAATEGKPDQALAAARDALAAGLHMKLRSFVPALKAYCAAGNVDAAFEVSAELLLCRMPEMA